MKKFDTKKNKESNPEIAECIMQKRHNTAIINRKKRNSVLAYTDQIRLKDEYEEQKDEEIFTIPCVNDL